jgi:hypothetical protein
MSTWVEMLASVVPPKPEPAWREERPVPVLLSEPGSLRRAEQGSVPFFPRPLGTACHSFEQRLARARLIYARRREAAFHWIALTLAMFIVLAAPSIGDRCADGAQESGMRCLQATEML